jgi:flagellar biosynthetic protein FliQ
MSQEMALGLGQQSMWIALQIAAPVILAGLVVGLLVSIFQAATQIQEQSLLFVPKVLALVAALGLCGGWMMTRIIEFARALILSLPMFAR